ncbi:ABC transporter ATP-binding protein [Sphingomonas sp.]|uniref:ABC transporter ATP-binding protein n=1 Tax=Sphingomonas sp. TaxID=28214 RepID=UPI0025EA9368|nr:ABC transporter ATP-binding protein [Sphingomonas sp.]
MPRRPASSDVAPVRILPMIAAFARDLQRSAGRRGALGIAATLLTAALESIGLILIMPLLAVALGRGSRQPVLDQVIDAAFERIGITGRQGQLMVMLGAFAALFVVRALAASARDILLTQSTIDFVDTRRKQVVRSTAGARWDVIARLHQARFAQILGADVQNVAMAARQLQFALVAAVTLAGQCVAAVVLSPQLSLLCLVVLALGAIALTSTLRQAHSLGKTSVESNLSAMNTVVQFFGGLKLAVSQDLQSSYIDEVEGALDNIAEHQLIFVRRQARRQVLIGAVAAIAGMAVAAAGLFVFHLAPAVLVGLLLILVRMTGPAASLRQYSQQLVQLLPAYRALTDLEAELAATAAPAVAPTDDAFDFRGDVDFRGVGFAHAVGDGERVLDDCSLSIARGEFVGLTGLSGAGKTTLVDLLVGLFEPQAGEVTIDGVPLRGTALPAWRHRVSYISQDPYLFYDSIRRNLLWANPAASEEALWNALRLAGADALVRRMAHGLDAVVGERGTLISGGERQRLAIARALLRNPRMLILDEATNAIDIAAERALIGNLLALSPRPTIVMIAHRTESLAQCDRILRLESGRIAALDAAPPGVLDGVPCKPVPPR